MSALFLQFFSVAAPPFNYHSSFPKVIDTPYSSVCPTDSAHGLSASSRVPSPGSASRFERRGPNDMEVVSLQTDMGPMGIGTCSSQPSPVGQPAVSGCRFGSTMVRATRTYRVRKGFHNEEVHDPRSSQRGDQPPGWRRGIEWRQPLQFPSNVVAPAYYNTNAPDGIGCGERFIGPIRVSRPTTPPDCCQRPAVGLQPLQHQGQIPRGNSRGNRNGTVEIGDRRGASCTSGQPLARPRQTC